MIRQYLLLCDEFNDSNQVYLELDLEKDVIVKEVSENAFEVTFDDELDLDLLKMLKKHNVSGRVYRLIFTNRKERV